MTRADGARASVPRGPPSRSLMRPPPRRSTRSRATPSPGSRSAPRSPGQSPRSPSRRTRTSSRTCARCGTAELVETSASSGGAAPGVRPRHEPRRSRSSSRRPGQRRLRVGELSRRSPATTWTSAAPTTARARPATVPARRGRPAPLHAPTRARPTTTASRHRGTRARRPTGPAPRPGSAGEQALARRPPAKPREVRPPQPRHVLGAAGHVQPAAAEVTVDEQRTHPGAATAAAPGPPTTSTHRGHRWHRGPRRRSAERDVMPRPCRRPTGAHHARRRHLWTARTAYEGVDEGAPTCGERRRPRSGGGPGPSGGPGSGGEKPDHPSLDPEGERWLHRRRSIRPRATRTRGKLEQIWSVRSQQTTMTPLREGPSSAASAQGDQACISLPSYRVEPGQTGPSVDCPRVGTRCVSRLFSGSAGSRRRACPMAPVYSPSGGDDKT